MSSPELPSRSPQPGSSTVGRQHRRLAGLPPAAGPRAERRDVLPPRGGVTCGGRNAAGHGGTRSARPAPALPCPARPDRGGTTGIGRGSAGADAGSGGPGQALTAARPRRGGAGAGRAAPGGAQELRPAASASSAAG